MATESRRTDPPVERILFEEGYRFDFFQAVRVLERLYQERQPVGGDARPSTEVVRFRARLDLSFPASQIQEIDPPDDSARPARMTVNFMGLTGPSGVLPHHYTELLMERVRQKDEALRDFLDLFNHRLISLFYRAWEKYHFPVTYERAALQGEEYDRFSLDLFALIGLGTEGLQHRVGIEDAALLFYAGLLAQHPRSAAALQGLLTEYFQVAVKIVQLIGEWLPLCEEDRTRLGAAHDNNALGVSTVLGNRVWNQQAKFRIEIGPLTLDAFHRFLPSGSAHRSLMLLVRFFAGQELNFDVKLVLLAAEVPRLRLGEHGERAPRLGWSTWLKTREFTHDAEDTILRGAVTLIGALPG